MKGYILLTSYALLISFTLCSCNKEKLDTVIQLEAVTLDADGLPKLTGTGLNSFGFIENGQPHWGSNEHQINSLVGRKSPSNSYLQMNLTVQDLSNNSYKYMLVFQLDTAYLIRDYTYQLKRPYSFDAWVSIERLIRNPSTSGIDSRMDWSDNINSSTLKVTTYDRSKRILAGTFSLKTAYFTITKGRFDIKLEN
ncbi:MAG: hypothetical protein V4594_13800 [Bacteroidota bacterium]